MARTVKSDKKTALGTRLDLVVALFSARFMPWRAKPLNDAEFAEIVGRGLSGHSLKNWRWGDTISAEGAGAIAALAETAGIPGITYRWLYYGEGPGPEGALGSVRALSLLDQLGSLLQDLRAELARWPARGPRPGRARAPEGAPPERSVTAAPGMAAASSSGKRRTRMSG